MKLLVFKRIYKVSMMSQRVKVTAMPNNLSLVPGTHMKVGRREMT